LRRFFRISGLEQQHKQEQLENKLGQPTARELGVAERVARRIGQKWSLVEEDDLTSHLYLWILTNESAVARWRSESSGEGKLYVALRREAAKYCAKEQAARVGRPLNDGNFYTSEIVSRALPFIFEDAPETIVLENPVTGQTNHSVGEYGLGQAILADIQGSFYGLNPDVQTVLEWRFRDGLTFDEIGDLREITPRGAKKQVDRAVSRLVEALSGEPAPF
jgi:DNA-directed RNA polymerase specialized sigma24 family protein